MLCSVDTELAFLCVTYNGQLEKMTFIFTCFEQQTMHPVTKDNNGPGRYSNYYKSVLKATRI